jgi:hypothetical protein
VLTEFDGFSLVELGMRRAVTILPLGSLESLFLKSEDRAHSQNTGTVPSLHRPHALKFMFHL